MAWLLLAILLPPHPVRFLPMLPLRYHGNPLSCHCPGHTSINFSLKQLHGPSNWLPEVRPRCPCRLTLPPGPSYNSRRHLLAQEYPWDVFSLTLGEILNYLACALRPITTGLCSFILCQPTFMHFIVLFFPNQFMHFKPHALLRRKLRSGMPILPTSHLAKILFLLQKPSILILCTSIERWSSVSQRCITGKSVRYILLGAPGR